MSALKELRDELIANPGFDTVPTEKRTISGLLDRIESEMSAILMASVNVSSEEILAMGGPDGIVKELLPEPSGRFYYVLHGIVAHYRFGTTPYSGEFRGGIGYGPRNGEEVVSPSYVISNLGLLNFAYVAGPGNLSAGAPILLNQDQDVYFQQSIPGVYNAWYAQNGPNTPNIGIEARPIVMNLDEGLAPVTDGDGSLTLRLWYSLIDGTSNPI